MHDSLEADSGLTGALQHNNVTVVVRGISPTRHNLIVEAMWALGT